MTNKIDTMMGEWSFSSYYSFGIPNSAFQWTYWVPYTKPMRGTVEVKSMITVWPCTTL